MNVVLLEGSVQVGVTDEVGVSGGVALLDDAADGGSPPVVAPGVQEALVDSSTNKMFL